MLLHPVTKVNAKLHQPNPGRMTNGTDPSGIKILVTPPEKEPRPPKVLPESRRNTEWVAEEGSFKYQLRLQNQLKKTEDLS